METKMNKKCKIINGQFCWFLQVDGQDISFQGSWCAKYFRDHYKGLGYRVEFLEDPPKDEEPKIII